MNPLTALDAKEHGPEPLKLVGQALLSSTFLEAVPDATLVVNREGIVLQANSQIETLFGYTRDELIGQAVEILVPDRQRRNTTIIEKASLRSPRSAAWEQDWTFSDAAVTAPSFRWRSASVQ